MGASKNSSVFDKEKFRMAGDQLTKASSTPQSDAELSTYARYSPETPSKSAMDARSRYLAQGVSAPIPFSLIEGGTQS
jgi:hypothetical protein